MLFHWFIAFLVIGLLSVGFYMHNLPQSLFKTQIVGFHKSIGILVLTLTVCRLLWRLVSVIPSLASLPLWEKLSAKLMHWLLYLGTLCMPLSGWLMTSSAGRPLLFFNTFTVPSLVETNSFYRHFFRACHHWLAYGLLFLISVHTLAALKHHFFNRDTILKRMLKG
ncbi:MAG TPA: cytochrome B [Legionellales bacterium]|nr:cytochrome B [Legionellales bacterium]